MNKLLLLGLLFLVPVSIASADMKVAVIDLAKTFDQYYKTKDAQVKIKGKQDQFQKDYQDLVTQYQHMGEEAQGLDKQAKDATLSAEARADKSKALDAKKQDLMNLERKIEETKVERGRELQDEIVRRHKELVDEISKIITDYSGPQGFDLVIDKSSSSAASGVPIILYNSSKLIDITQDIITKLNAGAPPAGTATAPATPAPAGTASAPAAPAVH